MRYILERANTQIYICDIFTHHLLARIVHQHVQLAELLHVLVDNLSTLFDILKVERNAEALSTLLLNHSFRILGVWLLLWQIDYGDIGALTGHLDRYCTPDAGVTAGNDDFAVEQLLGAAVLDEAVGAFELGDFGRRLHVSFKAELYIYTYH